MEDIEFTEFCRTALDNIADRVESEQEYLTELDSKIGDADFGNNLAVGCAAARERVAKLEEPSPAELLETIGNALVEEMAGSSGIVFGMSFMQASETLENGVCPETVVSFVRVYADCIQKRGSVDLGAKTVYDAIVPVADTCSAAVELGEADPVTVSARVVEAARRGAMFTTVIRAKRGRASYTEWQSVGHPDPGAVGLYVVLDELHRTLEEVTGESAEPGLEDGFA